MGAFGLLLLVVNMAISYRGFTKESFLDSYKFEVDKILIDKDYKRLVTSGFLHVGWGHLVFNMLSLYFFNAIIELTLGALPFLTIYFASLIGGNLLSLLVHKNHGNYSSVGASGAICGIIFAAIALFPGFSVGFWGMGFSIPGWLYGALYVAYTIYGIKSDKDDVGHAAHLGGALVGMLVGLIFRPAAFSTNYLTILMLTVPTIVFIYLIAKRPHILLIGHRTSKVAEGKYYSLDDKYNAEKSNNKKEIDRILDKISSKGMSSLTEKEKEKLKAYSD